MDVEVLAICTSRCGAKHDSRVSTVWHAISFWLQAQEALGPHAAPQQEPGNTFEKAGKRLAGFGKGLRRMIGKPGNKTGQQPGPSNAAAASAEPPQRSR